MKSFTIKWQLFRVQSSCTDHLPPSRNGISTEKHGSSFLKALKTLWIEEKYKSLLGFVSCEWALALITTRETITIKISTYLSVRVCVCVCSTQTKFTVLSHHGEKPNGMLTIRHGF